MSFPSDGNRDIRIKVESSYAADPTVETTNAMYVEAGAESTYMDIMRNMDGPSPYGFGFKPKKVDESFEYKYVVPISPITITDNTSLPEIHPLWVSGGWYSPTAYYAAGPPKTRSYVLTEIPERVGSMAIEDYMYDSADAGGIVKSAFGCRHDWVLRIPSNDLWALECTGKGVQASEVAAGSGRPALDYSTEMLQSPLVGGNSVWTISGDWSFSGNVISAEFRGQRNPVYRRVQSATFGPSSVELRPRGPAEVDLLIDIVDEDQVTNFRSYIESVDYANLKVEQPAAAAGTNNVELYANIAIRDLVYESDEAEFMCMRITGQCIFGDSGGDGGGREPAETTSAYGMKLVYKTSEAAG